MNPSSSKPQSTSTRAARPASRVSAVRLHRFGGPKELRPEQIETPTPGRDEVLVEIHAAAVNPVDTKIRSGQFKQALPPLPAILGRDFSGVVLAKGAGVDGRFGVGDAVFGMLGYDRGTYAEAALARPQEIARRPEEVDEVEAATLGVAALTAWQCLFDHGKLKAGERVLIHGGAGGVGHFAVQFAKVKGAHVITTAGEKDREWLEELGADEVIDYKNERFEEKVRDVDLVIDLIAGDTQERSWRVLKPKGGRLISTLAEPSAAEAEKHGAQASRMMVKVDAGQLAEIAQLVADGKVRVELGKVLPLSQAADAHELMEHGHVRGKVVLRVK